MDVYTEWEFIASIPKNTKPCFNDKTLVQTGEWFVTFKRRYKGEKGERGILHVENLIRETEKDPGPVKNLLPRALIGLQNLVSTYKSDGQIEVSQNYQRCIHKVETILKKKKSFFVTPKTYYNG
tara:strand:+ start:2341 stop:2712 length:372 start_codon:yes stop_codon:yes gene_type:complete